MDHEAVEAPTANEGNQLPSRAREWVIPLFFTAISAIFYAPILLWLRAFHDGDFVHHFFPFSLFQFDALSQLHLPAWNPYTYGGHPFLADVQAAVFYPVSNLLYLLTLPISDMATRFYLLEVEAVVHTVLAGIFAYLWTRDLVGSRWGGLIGGICFALSGYITGYAPLQLAVLRTAIWLPLLLWSLGRAWQNPRRWRWWLVTIAGLCAAFFAGHSQTFMLLGYTTLAWVITLAIAYRPVQRVAIKWTTMVCLVTIGLCAAQSLPSLEFVRYSVRANVNYDFVSGGLSYADFWQILLPGVLTQFSPLYIGVVGIALVIIGIFRLGAVDEVEPESRLLLLPNKVGILFCLALAIFALLASLGGNGPLYPLLYRVAPGWSWFRGQERAAYLVAVALSGLAAYGMAAIPELSPQARRRCAMMIGVVVVGVVYAFGLLWQLQGRTAVDHTTYLLTTAVTLILGLTVAGLIAQPGWSNRRNITLVTLAFVNLLWANAATNQQPGTPQDRVIVAPEVSALRAAVAEEPEAANGLPGRVYNEYRAYDDYGMRSQIEDVWGSSPLRLARYSALFDQFPLDRMWRLLGVQHVLTWRHDLFGPSELLAQFPQATDTTYLHRLPEANPRAWLVPQVQVADDDASLGLLADHQFDLSQTGLLGIESQAFAEVSGKASFSSTVTLRRTSTESYEVKADSPSDALLIVSEVWLPGWEVVNEKCNGTNCPAQDSSSRQYLSPLRADLTLLGIWLPAGESTFMLRYNPQSILVGLWISGLTLCALFVSIVWHLASRRSRLRDD